MSGQNRSNSFNLKHRLTGAAILIGFAVIVLPMLLSGPDGSGSSGPTASTQDDPDTRVFRSNITPIGGATPSFQSQKKESAGQPVASAEPADDADGRGETPRAESQPASDVATEAEDGPAQAPADGDEPQVAAVDESAGGDAAREEAAPTVERGWIVQVGTFKNPANVDKLVTQLKNNGFGTSTSEVETSGGSATRVWVGPYETRVEAARVKTRVKQRTGSEGLIVAYP